MEKLTIEHIAPYLPYSVKMIYEKSGRIITLKTLGQTSNGHLTYAESEDFITTYITKDWNFKPILRPLSDLTIEIEHNGEKFIPIYRLAELFLYSDIFNKGVKKYEVRDNYILVTFGTADGTNSSIQTVQIKTSLYRMEWWQLQKLFEWHFDVFGLIEKDLAINKNEI